ncbi:hypothetical protein Ciccas_001117 [Cichlidogyrus casuarinus]|uniref:Bicarbonate transporter-like transmembrane domain-containing protein n=1 Tax=Cichlidogyrus casuarinus TaxID=1844966 RepID=A0ABD2QL80_9PLAT
MKVVDSQKVRKQPEYRKRYLDDFCPPMVTIFKAWEAYLKRWPSDFTDAFKTDNVALTFTSIFFVYFVCLAPSITFGALLSGSRLIAGQPLAINGVTAATFIIESSIVSFANSFSAPILVVRAWISVYASIFGIIGLVFNVSVLTNHVRRSVEQVFNMFISFFFLLKALFTMFKPDLVLSQKNAIAGATLFLALLMLNFCLTLASIKRGTYFRQQIRKILGAFNVPLGIILTLAMNQIFFLQYQLPTLSIPPSDQINVSQWINSVPLDQMFNYGKAGAATIQGISVVIGFAVFLLIFTEASLNGITAMKNKAVKPGIPEADLLLLLVAFPLTSGFLGWPFVSGAPLRTVSHIMSLAKMEERPPPGVTAQVVATVEQRVSGILVGLLVALSVLLGSVLQYIPLAALYGMFLYMGVIGMRDLTITHRIQALMKRRKHWQDWEYIRGVPTPQILFFAFTQSFFVLVLITLNVISEFLPSAAAATLMFPIVIAVYALIREFVLPCWPWISPYLHQLDKKHKISPVIDRQLAIAEHGPCESRRDSDTPSTSEQIRYRPNVRQAEHGSEDVLGRLRETWAI